MTQGREKQNHQIVEGGEGNGGTSESENYMTFGVNSETGNVAWQHPGGEEYNAPDVGEGNTYGTLGDRLPGRGLGPEKDTSPEGRHGELPEAKFPSTDQVGYQTSDLTANGDSSNPAGPGEPPLEYDNRFPQGIDSSSINKPIPENAHNYSHPNQDYNPNYGQGQTHTSYTGENYQVGQEDTAKHAQGIYQQLGMENPNNVGQGNFSKNPNNQKVNILQHSDLQKFVADGGNLGTAGNSNLDLLMKVKAGMNGEDQNANGGLRVTGIPLTNCKDIENMILSHIRVSEPSRNEVGLSGNENESGTEVRAGEGLIHPESSNFDPSNHNHQDHTRKERSLSVEKPMQKAKKDKTRPHRKTSLKGGKSSQNPEKTDTFQPSGHDAPSSSTGPAIGKQPPSDANAAKKRGPKRKNKPDLKGDREIGLRDETGFTPNRSHVRRDQESSGNQHSDPANPTHNPKQSKAAYQDGQGQGVSDWKINEYEDYPSDQDRAKGVKRMVLGLEDLVREKFEIIRETINQKSHADLCIPDQLTLAFDNIQKDILEKLQNVIKSKVKTEFICNFEDMILPVFEKYLQKIFEKVCATFEKGHKFYVDRLMIENSKSNNLRESLNQLLDNFLNASENIRTSVQDTAQLQYNLMKTYEANMMKGEFAAINGKLETMMGHQNSLMGQILSMADRLGHLEQRDRLSVDVFEKFENRLIGVISKLNNNSNSNSNPNVVTYQNSIPNAVVYQSAPLVIQRDNFAEVQKREIAHQGRVNMPVSGSIGANRPAQDRPIGNFFDGEPVRVVEKPQAHVNLPARNLEPGASSGANIIQEPIDNSQRPPQQGGNRQPERGAQSGNDRGAPKGNGSGNGNSNGNGNDRGMPKKGNYIKYGNHVVKLDSDDE
jgi:hypothetical protein